LFGVLLAVCIGLIIWGNHSWIDWMEAVGVVGGLLDLVAFIVALCCTMTLQDDFDYIESQYNNLKEQIEYCDRDDIVTDGNLRKQVLDMNNTIAKHREYCHNAWIGVYYSEHIGSLENLKWKSNKE